MQEAAKAATAMYAETSARNPAFKKIYEHQLEFRNQAYVSWQAMEFSYDSLMIQLIRQQRR
jgi:TRAP-type mannitol/chloroaromatic compound transport system substrate-binding protein